jgi:hypothetical protein
MSPTQGDSIAGVHRDADETHTARGAFQGFVIDVIKQYRIIEVLITYLVIGALFRNNEERCFGMIWRA